MSETSLSPEVLLVVPTLGHRLTYLRETLQSIRSQSIEADVVIVAPREVEAVEAIAKEFGAVVLPDPGSLPAAINLGARQGLRQHAFINWLNDDDLLEPNALSLAIEALVSDPDAVVAFGGCRYIDEEGRELWINRAGIWAPRILKWGPDLIPQPGMLIRSDAWREAGGLDETYRMAFDLDLLLRLQRHGKLVYAGAIVSSFRWHRRSLTVDDRATNLAESSRAKRAALGPFARRMAWLWEWPVGRAIAVAAHRVNRRAEALSRAE